MWKKLKSSMICWGSNMDNTVKNSIAAEIGVVV